MKIYASKILKKKKLYEGSQKIQDAWIDRLPWAKFVVNDKGEVHQVRCMICVFIKRKDKLLAPKLNSLLKHVGC
jgi:hypothetical protein